MMTAKFRSLAQHPLHPFPISSDFAARPYDQHATAFLQGLSLCVHELAKLVAVISFRRFSKKVLLVHPGSWLHSRVILMLLRAVDRTASFQSVAWILLFVGVCPFQ
jgi:hypothetical protein